jgi:hypothetical protein
MLRSVGISAVNEDRFHASTKLETVCCSGHGHRRGDPRHLRGGSRENSISWRQVAAVGLRVAINLSLALQGQLVPSHAVEPIEYKLVEALPDTQNIQLILE